MAFNFLSAVHRRPTLFIILKHPSPLHVILHSEALSGSLEFHLALTVACLLGLVLYPPSVPSVRIQSRILTWALISAPTLASARVSCYGFSTDGRYADGFHTYVGLS